MPWKSDAQRRWGHTKAGIEALGGTAKVHEWDEATKGMKIPKKAVKGAAARLAAMQSKHGSEEKGEKHGAMTNPMSYREEMSEQKKEMSKTKRGKR